MVAVLELTEPIPLAHSCNRSSRYCNRVHDFSVAILRYYKDVYVIISFSDTARLWNSLPAECFPLTSDLNDCQARVNRRLLSLGSYQTAS